MLSTTVRNAKRSLYTTAVQRSNTGGIQFGRWTVHSSGLLSCRLRSSDGGVAFREFPRRESSWSYSSRATSGCPPYRATATATSTSFALPHQSDLRKEQRSLRYQKWRSSTSGRIKRHTIRSQQGVISFVLLDFLDRDQSNRTQQDGQRFFSSTDKGPPSLLGKGESSSLDDENSNKKPRVISADSRRISNIKDLLDTDRDLYKQIRKLQNRKKEESQQKTAKNVYRALCANGIICVAKLFGTYVHYKNTTAQPHKHASSLCFFSLRFC
jgi:hypothetical protein